MDAGWPGYVKYGGCKLLEDIGNFQKGEYVDFIEEDVDGWITLANDEDDLEKVKLVDGKWKDMPNNRRTMMRTMVNIREDIRIQKIQSIF